MGEISAAPLYTLLPDVWNSALFARDFVVWGLIGVYRICSYDGAIVCPQAFQWGGFSVVIHVPLSPCFSTCGS